MKTLLGVLLFAGPLAHAADYNANAANLASGDKIRGPAVVHVTGINVVRYGVRLGAVVTYSAGPSLTGIPFVPPIPQGGGQPPAGGAAPAGGPPGAPAPAGVGVTPSDVGGRFDAAVKELNRIEQARTDLQNEIQRAIDAVNLGKDEVDSLVGASDSLLAQANDGSSIVAQVAAIEPDIQTALHQQWPATDINALAGGLAKLRNDLNDIQTLSGWETWYKDGGHRTAYDRAAARVSELITDVAGLDPTRNASAATMRTAQRALREWNDLLVSLRSPVSFQEDYTATCSLVFGGNKESKVQLVKQDRLAAAGSALITEEVVTVVCSSPLSISGGFGFSTVPERDIDLIASSKAATDASGKPILDANGKPTTENISLFGYKARSSFHPLPVLLLNVRLHEWTERWSLHGSAGAAVDLKTGSAAGADVEYIAGLSLGIARTVFLTGGLHAGRTSKLTGGFQIGQEVPSGIAKPPTETTWTPGLFIGLTYKLR